MGRNLSTFGNLSRAGRCPVRSERRMTPRKRVGVIGFQYVLLFDGVRRDNEANIEPQGISYLAAFARRPTGYRRAFAWQLNLGFLVY